MSNHPNRGAPSAPIHVESNAAFRERLARMDAPGISNAMRSRSNALTLAAQDATTRGDSARATDLLTELNRPDEERGAWESRSRDSTPPPAPVRQRREDAPARLYVSGGGWERLAEQARESSNGELTASREYADAFRLYIASRGEIIPQMLVEANRERHLSIGRDSDGGYLVPAQQGSGIITQLPAASEILDLVTVVPTSRNEIEWPRIVPHGSSPDIYTSAFVGSMVGETPAEADGDAEPDFGLFPIATKKARVKARPSMDLWDDVPSFENWLVNDGATNLGLVMASQILNGDGIGKNVLGVLNTPDITATSDVSGTTADQISNTAADQGSAPKLLDCLYSVPAQYRRRPSFRLVFSSDSELRIRKLVDANGRFMWTNDGGFGPRSAGFDGYGVAVDDFVPSGGTNGNRVILAGDLSQIYVAMRSDVTIQILRERFAETDQIGVILRARFGVGVANPRALKIAIV